MKQITPAQHARAVLTNHATFSGRYDGEYRMFAKPGETQADAIKRYMAARKRDWKKADPRQFPRTAEALANTKAYVEAYYALNFKDEVAGRKGGASEYVRDLFGELSTADTTWPETDEVSVEFDD